MVKKKEMSFEESRQLARSLFADGKSYAEIGEILTERGCAGRSGQGLSRSAVYKRVHYANGVRTKKKPYRRASTVTKASARTTGLGSTKLEGAAHILRQESLRADDRIALALLLLEA